MLELNSERFVHSTKRGMLGEYVARYHSGRNYQGVGKRFLASIGKVGSSNDPIHCRERLGGMLNFYYTASSLKVLVTDYAPSGI